MNDKHEFKKCPKCDFIWLTRKEFLGDPGAMIIGYQVQFQELVAGLFMFNHTCGTTLVIAAAAFRDLYDGPVFAEPLTGTEECPEYCLRKDELRWCPAKCACAYVREIIQVINNWPRTRE